MADTDSEINAQLSEDLSETSASLIHDISTPLAIVKVNCEFIARYLPTLLEHFQADGQHGNEPIPPAHLEALTKAPDVIVEQVTLVQQRALRYWREMEQKLKDAAPAASLASGESLCHGPSLRFLCVEDNIALQDATLKLLTPHHQVDIAINSREALKKCAESDYDVILLSTQFIDDRVTAASLKQAAANTPKVFALTNNSEDGDYLQAGFDALLARPPQAEDLKRTLSAIVADTAN